MADDTDRGTAEIDSGRSQLSEPSLSADDLSPAETVTKTGATPGLAFGADVDPDTDFTTVERTEQTQATGFTDSNAMLLRILPFRLGLIGDSTSADSSERAEPFQGQRVFHPRNVPKSASYAMAFTGRFSLAASEIIEHAFHVHTHDDFGGGTLVARIVERRIELPQDRPDGDPRLAEKNSDRIDLAVDPELDGRHLEYAVYDYLDRWHQRYATVATQF
jgi:hypothetical protein